MRQGAPACAAGCRTGTSGAKEREPDDAEDQHREAGRGREQGEHRRPGLGLACFGRGFDDLIMPSGCHGALDSFDSRKGPVDPCGITCACQRMIPDQVPVGPARAAPRPNSQPYSPAAVNAVARFPAPSACNRVPRWYLCRSPVAFSEYPMAPRANWKGFLRLSLVTCPVALYPATSDTEKVSFNQINRKTGHRIKYAKVDADTGEEVEASDIMKDYKVDTDTYIEVSKDELDELALESTRTIEIDEFVPKSDIDNRYLIRPYYLVPDGKVGHDAFAVIRETI